MESKKKGATILAIFAVALVVIGIVIGVVVVRSRGRSDDKLLKSIVEKMKQVENYQFDLSGNYAGNRIAVTAKAVCAGNQHVLYMKTNLQAKDEENSIESEIQYDFDLVEQRYLQKILHQGKVIHTNSFSSTEENPLDLDLLDVTRILTIFADLLTKKNATMHDSNCTISIAEEDVNQFLFMMELLTYHTSGDVLSGDSLQLTYKLNKEKETIEEVSLYQGKKEMFQFTFRDFKTPVRSS